MRLSFVSGVALCSALAVSAHSIPQIDHQKRAHPHKAPEGWKEAADNAKFHLLNLDDVKADLADKGFSIINHTSAGPPDHIRLSASFGSGVAGASFRTPAPHTRSTNAKRGNCASYETHLEWRNMADSDKTAFVQAVRSLFDKPSAGGFPGSQNRYEDLVSLHQQQTPNIHGVGQFLPWHRYYLYVFLSILREEAGYNGPMPWWDETKDAGNFESAPLFTDAWFGAAPPKASDGSSPCITNGAFGDVSLHLGPGGGTTDSGRCLARGVDEGATANCNSDWVNSCNSYGSYGDMEGCAEGGPHAYGHNGLGGFMGDVAPSPSDPSFFMHHGFVDRNWVAWQNGDIQGRLYSVAGSFSDTGKTTALDLNYVLTSMGIRPDATVNDVMDTQGGFLCYYYDS